ncbi:MAG TPA: MATE family efflux transporter [Bordetella sp.]
MTASSHAPAQSLGTTMLNIMRQAWPVLVGQWASIAFGVLDTAMTGHSSPADLAAMSLSASIYITVFVGLMGVVHALIPILAQHYGAQRHHEVGRLWGQGVWLALGLSVLGGAIMQFPDAWLSMSGNVDPAVRERMASYLEALTLALPAMLVFRTIYALGSAVSRPRVAMLINLAAVLLKVLFNWLLIYGQLGLPAMGATGAGLSTALVAWLGLGAGLWFVTHDRGFAMFRLRLGWPQWHALKELLRLGLPMGGSYLIEVSAFTFMALLVAREGTYVLGGHQIMSNLAALCYMMPMSIGVASSAVTAQSVGAASLAQARRTGWAGLALGLLGALLTSAVVLAGRPYIVAAYTSDAQVAAAASSLVMMMPLFHLWDAFQCINAYLLRAYKVAVAPLLIQTLALAVVGLLGGWWFGFGPGEGGLDGVIAVLMPGARTGAGSLWLMAMIGLGLSALLLHGWYWRTLRRLGRRAATPDLSGI